MHLPLITLEEHFFSSSAAPLLEGTYAEQMKALGFDVVSKLNDLSDLRLRDMDAGGVSLQVVSHAPGLGEHGAAVCCVANNELALAVNANTDRFAGFAVAPMLDPPAAAAELRRAVQELGFVGALVDNHCRGVFYDGLEYDVWWAAAEELGVPVYLHPSWPSDDMMALHRGNFSEAAALSMASSGLSWHTETARHVLRLFASGLFDRRPRLKIVVGHMGETLPFLLQRIEALSRRWGTFERDFRTVYDENIWITTSGVWSLDPMRCILANTKLERILYSVDYPFATNEAGLKWIHELQESGLVDEEQLKAIAYENAEKLLGVKAVRTAP